MILARRPMRLRLLVIAIVLVVQLAWWAAPTCAGLLGEVQDTLAELTRQALSIKESILGSRQRESDVFNLLVRREAEIEKAHAELRSLIENSSALESEIASLELELARRESEARALAASLEYATDSVRMQLRYLQRHGRADGFLSFLASESSAESDLTIRALDQVLRLTDRLASEHSSKLAELNDKRSGLLQTIRDLDRRKSELARARQNQEVALTELDRSVQETRLALEQARSEITEYEQTLRMLEESSAELQSLIEEQEREAAELERKAREGWINSFAWPVRSAGVVSGSDGGRPGIDIETEGSAQIVAARSGQVSHSGWVDGYGSTVVINHGSGYSTIYAHCHHLRVAVGDFVIAGDVIAEMGSPASESSPCLYFEVRKDGVPLDPVEYLE